MDFNFRVSGYLVSDFGYWVSGISKSNPRKFQDSGIHKPDLKSIRSDLDFRFRVWIGFEYGLKNRVQIWILPNPIQFNSNTIPISINLIITYMTLIRFKVKVSFLIYTKRAPYPMSFFTWNLPNMIVLTPFDWLFNNRTCIHSYIKMTQIPKIFPLNIHEHIRANWNLHASNLT